MARRASILLLALLCACGPSEAPSLRLDVPLRPNTRAVVVAVELPNELIVVAFDVEDPTPIVRSIDLAKATKVTALLYEQNLDDLRLTPGPLIQAPATAERVRPLPLAAEVLGTDVVDGDLDLWVPRTILPDALASLRIEDAGPCGRFSAETIPLPGTGQPSFALGLDESVLVGTQDGELFRVDRAGAVRTLVAPDTFFDGYRRSDGKIYLGGRDGRVWLAEDDGADLTFTATATALHRQDILAIDGSKDGPVEHFVLTTTDGQRPYGWLEHHTGSGFRRVFDKSYPGDVTFVGPGHAVMWWGYEQQVQGVEDGEVYRLQVPLPFSGVESLEFVPDAGLVVGTEHGHLAVLPNDEWSLLTLVRLQLVLRIRAYRGRFVFVMQDGIYEVSRDSPNSICEPVVAPPEGPAALGPSLATVGDDVVAVAEATPTIVWFRRR